MRSAFAFLIVLVTAIGAVGTLAPDLAEAIFYDVLPSKVETWVRAMFVGGVVASVLTSQIEKIGVPRIRFLNVVIEAPKKLFLSHSSNFLLWRIHRRIPIYFPAVYILVSAKPGIFSDKNIEKVFPSVSWYLLNGKGPIEQNNGRWWISNVSDYVDKSTLQTIDLLPNEQPRRLYFARVWKGYLSPWFRTQDDKEPDVRLTHDKYFVEINLTSTNGAKAVFRFVISYDGFNLEIQEVDRWRRKSINGTRVTLITKKVEISQKNN